MVIPRETYVNFLGGRSSRRHSLPKVVSRWSEGGLKGVRSELEGSQGHPKGVQMMSDELAKWPDEGSTAGKTFAGSDFAKVKGSSGFGLPRVPSQEVE